MNAVPPNFDAALAADAPEAMGWRWEALAEAAQVVAVLGGIEPTSFEPHDFTALLRDAEPLRRERAEHGIADLVAVMEPGIEALLAVNARGADPRPAAKALWREFAAARAAVLALLTPRPSA